MSRKQLVGIAMTAAVALGVLYLYKETHVLDFLFGPNTTIA